MGYRQILVPLDGSLLSEYVFPQVVQMARAFSSEVTLLYVVPPNGHLDEGTPPSKKQAVDNIIPYLEGIQDTLASRGMRVDYSILNGDPADEIAWYVKKHQTDMVVMSTHGQGEAYKRKVGSVAAKILDKVSAPVMMMRVPQVVANL